MSHDSIPDSTGADSTGAGSRVEAVIRVVSGSPSDDELGAVTAVLSALEAEQAAAAVEEATPVAASAWSRSQRSLRSPLTVGPGQWRAFHG